MSSVSIWQLLQFSILQIRRNFTILQTKRGVCVSVYKRQAMSEETKYVELCKGINGLDKIILREVRGCSAEVYFSLYLSLDLV
jgi:hypothetical protein